MPVEIIRNPPIHVKGSVGTMPTMPSTQSPDPAPTVPRPVTAAPPVPPPVEPKVDKHAPFENKSKKEFFNRLKEKSGIKTKTEDPPAPPAEPKEPTEPTEPTQPTEPTEPTTEPTTTDPKTKTKVSGWKMMEEWKAKALDLEKQLLETKKLIPDEVSRKTEVERLTKAESRAKELEDEIRYVNYAKSDEFKEKYDQPYSASFARAMQDLAEIAVQDAQTGDTRPAEPRDLLEIVNLPLGKAKEKAIELFGDFADEAMDHRKDVRKLWEDRVKGLDNARKTAAEREQQIQQHYQSTTTELQKFLHENWDKANEAVRQDPEHSEFFNPLEGDEERNSILEKGYEFADQALQGNPMDPSLKHEERVSIVKRHAALRNRAAAYGILRHLLAKERADHKTTQEKLKQYEGSTPNTQGSRTATVNGQPTRTTDQVFARLRGLARPTR